MKTKPMAHQLTALAAAAGRKFFAYTMEQGTGKTWVLLAEAERMFLAEEIDAVIVIAPRGVHTNWVLREIPTHVSVPHFAEAWRSGAGKRETDRRWARMMYGEEERTLRLFAINIEALATKDGFAFAWEFMKKHATMIVIDESSRIKNPSAARTKAAMRLRPLANVARIASGTPITNAPTDAFSQFEFLSSGLLGTRSYRAFVAEFACVLPATHPMMVKMVERNPRIARAQIIERDPISGQPKWRNLDKLHQLISRHSFRVLKDECIDLPAKIYTQVFFELSAKQRAAYKLMKDSLRILLEGDEVSPVSRLAAIVKLQQITSNFVAVPDSGLRRIDDERHPRLEALMNAIEDREGSFIVWCRFTEEIREVAMALEAEGIPFATYYGATSIADRERAVDDFQARRIRAFVGQPQSGGIGLTLTAAETVFYFSNDFNLETRLQSEDRAHRIGTTKHVVYIDLVARGTIDVKISEALRLKENLASTVLGDDAKRLLLEEKDDE